MLFAVPPEIFNNIKLIADRFFDKQEIDYLFMQTTGNNFFFGKDINHEVECLLPHLKKILSAPFDNIFSSNVSMVRSFGITHHVDQDGDCLLICTRGDNYVFGYHDKETDDGNKYPMPKSVTLEPGQAVLFRADRYHSLYSFKPSEQPFECVLIGLDAEDCL